MSKMIQLFYPPEVRIPPKMEFDSVEAKACLRESNNHLKSTVVLDLLNERVVLEGSGTRGKAAKVRTTKRKILSENQMRKTLEVTENCLQEMRIVDDYDTHRQRVILTYFCHAEAKAAVLKYHHTAKYKNICAVVASDLIDKIAEMERKIKSSSFTTCTQQIVTIAKGRYYYYKDFKRILTDMLSFVSSNFSISLITEENGFSVREAWVRFESLEEALSAELTFDGAFVECDKDRLQVKVGRQLAFVQHDLQCRVACILPLDREQKRRLRKKLTYVKDMSNFPEVGCINFDCEGCGNKFLKPPTN